MRLADADRPGEQDTVVNSRIFVGKLNTQLQRHLLRFVGRVLVRIEMALLIPFWNTGLCQPDRVGVRLCFISFSFGIAKFFRQVVRAALKRDYITPFNSGKCGIGCCRNGGAFGYLRRITVCYSRTSVSSFYGCVS